MEYSTFSLLEKLTFILPKHVFLQSVQILKPNWFTHWTAIRKIPFTATCSILWDMNKSVRLQPMLLVVWYNPRLRLKRESRYKIQNGQRRARGRTLVWQARGERA